MKYTIKVPPSKTEQTITVTIPDLPPSVTPVITGTTPIDGVPPVEDPPPAVTGTILYQNNFDKSTDINSNQLGRGSIATKDGRTCFRAEVRSGDGQISGGYRSEQQLIGSLSLTGEPFVCEYDEMFESFPNDVQGLSMQWHGNTSGTSGQLSLWISSGKFMVQRNVIGRAGSSNIYQSGNLKTIEKGRWYKMNWEVKFSPNSDGYVRMYIDGILYYSATGATSDGSGQYPKFGINLFKPDNVVVFIDNFKIWKP